MRLIQETLSDIGYFLILFLFILMTFGNALMIMGEGRGDEDAIYQNFFGIGFVDAVLNQYMLSLGEFDLDNHKKDG